MKTAPRLFAFLLATVSGLSLHAQITLPGGGETEPAQPRHPTAIDGRPSRPRWDGAPLGLGLAVEARVARQERAGRQRAARAAAP